MIVNILNIFHGSDFKELKKLTIHLNKNKTRHSYVALRGKATPC